MSLSKVKLKLYKLCTLSEVRLELLVKLFQSRLDLLVFNHGRKIQENAKKGKLQNFLRKTGDQIQLLLLYFKVVA